jgi:hypothetical protein
MRRREFTFDLGGQSLQRLIQHGQLNSPWGVAINTVFFTAGPNGEQDGLFGTITSSP